MGPIIGCVQLSSQFDIETNLANIQRAVIAAKQQDVHLLVLPENACRMGGQQQLAERFDELSQWYATLAFEHQMFIVAGSLPCAYRPDGTPVPGERLRQVSQLFSPEGKRVARYDKIHLFKAQVADNTGSYDEGRTFEPGDTTVVAQCDMANLLGQSAQTQPLSVGMMVCFDLRFPALAHKLRQSGAEILTAPSAFTYQTGKAHWQLLLQARALDAQCLVVGSAQGGTHDIPSGQRQTWGHSSIMNANGEQLVGTNQTELMQPEQGFELITAPFERTKQQNWRQNMPIHHCHRLA